MQHGVGDLSVLGSKQLNEPFEVLREVAEQGPGGNGELSERADGEPGLFGRYYLRDVFVLEVSLTVLSSPQQALSRQRNRLPHSFRLV